MPRDTLPLRPHFRLTTAEIATLVDTAHASNDSAALRVIADELAMRDRPAAKLLLVAVRNMLAGMQAAPVAPVAIVAPPAKPAPRKAAGKTSTMPWERGGNTLRRHDWSGFDERQAEHHAMIRAKYGSIDRQAEILARAERATMFVKGKYNGAAAAKFVSYMNKHAVDRTPPKPAETARIAAVSHAAPVQPKPARAVAF